MSDNPRGILRNKDELETSPTFQEKLDRQEVIKNTRLNSQLSNEQRSKGDEIRAKIAKAREEQGQNPHPDHLKWDEVNLYKAEQDKSATMKIDEPKTPYEQGFDPSGEYYQDDDEEEIPGFQLGEGSNFDSSISQSMKGSEVVKSDDHDADNEEEEEEPSEPLTAEQRHNKFNEMRKAHYHMKGSVLGKKVDVSDDED